MFCGLSLQTNANTLADAKHIKFVFIWKLNGVLMFVYYVFLVFNEMIELDRVKLLKTLYC